MDLIRLGPPGDTSYLPDTMIEGYSSAIWTERFVSPGDFQIKTPYIEKMLALLPEKTLISHRQTREVMMVEDHLIAVNPEGIPELTIVGRSVDSILESRYVEGPYNKRRKMAKVYSNTGAALVLVWNVTRNGSGNDVTRQLSGEDNDGDPHTWNTKDQIPNVSVSDSVANTDPVKRKWLREGMLYPQLIKFLNMGDAGIRTIRPPTDSEQQVSVRVNKNPAEGNFGDIVRTEVTNVTSLRFDIFDGLDRSHTQSANPKVIFNTLRGDILNAQNLWSIRDWKNACEVAASIQVPDVYRSGQSGYTGWDRRVMMYDAGEPDFGMERPEQPGRNASNAEWDAYEAKLAKWKNKRDAANEEFKEDSQDEALRELNKFRKLKVFTGDISTETPYKYKEHYNLGDIVSLKGKYGQIERMLVSEYVRTEDFEGDRGYPGLTLVDE